MLKVQEFLKENSVEKLISDYSIAVRQHTEFPELYLFKYSMIDSPMSEHIVRECRGIILDSSKDWKIVNYGFKKFFNYGEGHADQIDWRTAEVQEKLDGSLMQLYYYKDEWRVASSGTPGAHGDVHGYPMTFKDLFWQVWNELGYKLPDMKDTCYQFELMTPYNKIIVKNTKNRLVHIGARDRKTLMEQHPSVAGHKYGWEYVQAHPLTNLDQIIEYCKTLNPSEGEGFVVCDIHFNRIKVKSPQYVALSNVKEGFGPKRILEVILSGETDEFLSYFPEYEPVYTPIKERYDNMIKTIDEEYAKIKHIENKKEFALEATKTNIAHFLFKLKSGAFKSGKEALHSSQIKPLQELLKVDEIDFNQVPSGT